MIDRRIDRYIDRWHLVFNIFLFHIYKKKDMTNYGSCGTHSLCLNKNMFSSPLSSSLLQTDLSWPQLLPTTNSNPQNPISLYMSSDNNPASHTLRPWLHYKDPMDPPPEPLTLQKAAFLVFFLFFSCLSHSSSLMCILLCWRYGLLKCAAL